MHSLIPLHTSTPGKPAEGVTSALDLLPTQLVSFAKECIAFVPARNKSGAIDFGKIDTTLSGDMNGGSTRASITKNIKKERRLQGARILTMTELGVPKSNIEKCAGAGRSGRTRLIFKTR